MKESIKSVETAFESQKAFPGQPLSTPVTTATGLLELFTDCLKDMYWSENHLIKSLPKMVSAAGSSDLKAALAKHLELTKDHASRLETIFETLGIKIQAKKCDATEGLVMAGEHVIENTIAGTEARDTGLIMSALKVENFEITSYNGLIQLANTLGQPEVAALLSQNLSDETAASQMLMAMSQEKAAASE